MQCNQRTIERTGWNKKNTFLNLGNEIRIDCDNLKGIAYGKEQVFTRREVDILEYLFQFKKPVSRQDLLKQVWGYKQTTDVDTRTVDIHIAKLRKKIELIPKSPQSLSTIRGEGYKLEI